MAYELKNRRYLGSKNKLIDFISKIVSDNCKNMHSFCDLFGGTGCVGWHFNDKKTKIIINDILKCNYIPYEAFFGSETIDNLKINEILKGYNNFEKVGDNYFSENFSDTYYSRDNCRKIGFIRDDIEKKYNSKIINYREKCYLITSLIYSMDKIANTVGHYDAYRLNGDLDKVLFLDELDIPDNEVNFNNEIYCEDANELVKKISADVVYIDPPYNSRQYCDAYHLLENVARWDKPSVFGVAKKMSRQGLKSKYCLQSAPLQFEKLINSINAKYILVSYNNMGEKGAGRSQAKISDDDIIRVLERKGELKIFETDFQQFTTGKTKIDDHKERVFLCIVGRNNNQTKQAKKSDDLVKSPLNYTGGKYKLLPQLLEKFPKQIDTFVDVFGGGFNVGANVNANKIVYNDVQREVVQTIELFKKYDYTEICSKVDKIISEYGLSNTYEKGYDFYNCNSDSGVGSYNKGKYEKLRLDYNSSKNSERKKFMLLTLIIYSFNNQIRFNSKGEYNMPIGKRDFNNSTRKNVKDFANKINSLNVDFLNMSFEKIDILNMKNPFVYCDPPYYLGIASYNENEGWNIDKEKKLLNFLKKLDDNNIKFALSNVIEHKNLKHELLKEWVEDNRFNLIYIKSSYSNSNYQLKDKGTPTIEVLVTNY